MLWEKWAGEGDWSEMGYCLSYFLFSSVGMLDRCCLLVGAMNEKYDATKAKDEKPKAESLLRR